jgi:hypothetical protein
MNPSKIGTTFLNELQKKKKKIQKLLGALTKKKQSWQL